MTLDFSYGFRYDENGVIVMPTIIFNDPGQKVLELLINKDWDIVTSFMDAYLVVKEQNRWKPGEERYDDSDTPPIVIDGKHVTLTIQNRKSIEHKRVLVECKDKTQRAVFPALDIHGSALRDTLDFWSRRYRDEFRRNICRLKMPYANVAYNDERKEMFNNYARNGLDDDKNVIRFKTWVEDTFGNGFRAEWREFGNPRYWYSLDNISFDGVDDSLFYVYHFSCERDVTVEPHQIYELAVLADKDLNIIEPFIREDVPPYNEWLMPPPPPRD